MAMEIFNSANACAAAVVCLARLRATVYRLPAAAAQYVFIERERESKRV